jgi:hypothetical protein
MGAYEYQHPTPDVSGKVYVKKGSTGNGSSWANAYPELADVLLAAQSNTNIQQIWVAAGTYYPLYKAVAVDSYNNPTTDYDKAFVLVQGVKVYGGFAGTESSIDNRDMAANVTTLSGDIGTAGVSTDNCYHVVIGAAIADDGATVLDGFTVSGGNADGIDASIIVNLQAVWRDTGGGISNNNSSPTLTNMTISGNNAIYGGGISNDKSSPTLVNVTANGHSADYGGGIYNNDNSSPTLVNMTFSGNTADYGSGIDNYESSPNLYNTIMWGNNSINSDSVVSNFDSAPIYQYSLIQGLNPGGSNLNGKDAANNPQFVSTTDFRLQKHSPAINAGDTVAYLTARSLPNCNGEKDLDGNPRLSGAAIDLGAYEY